MDNRGDGARRPDKPGSTGHEAGGLAWGPDRWISSLTLLGMLGALVWRLVDDDPENRLVAAVLVAVCALVTLALVRIRVRLQATSGGIIVTGPLRSRQIAWQQISRISTPVRGRFGRRAALLELDVRPAGGSATADDELLTFGRFDLGTDPARVGRELQRRWSAAR